MAIITLPPTRIEIRPLFVPGETCFAQGDAGKQVSQQLDEILRQRNRTRVDYLSRPIIPDSDQEFDYIAVPPNRTFTVPTRYVFRGKGQPLPYDDDFE